MLGRKSKAKLMAITGTIVVIVIILSPLSLVAIIILLLVSSLSAYGIYRLPGLHEEQGARASLGTRRLALPAP